MIMHTPPQPPPQPMPITIFVHGTQVHAMFRDVDIRRFFPGTTQTPAGLSPLKTIPEKHLVKTFMHALAQADPENFPFEGMYSFGWSGGIEVKERCSAAKQLFDLLQSLSQSYQALHGTQPIITIITHSHGGNVLLHMASHHNPSSFSINRTLLLACPVQERTSSYVQHSVFGTLYSLHSHDDQFQIMDQGSLQMPRAIIASWIEHKKVNFNELFQTMKSIQWKFGSGRHFATQNNLIQASLRWDVAPQHRKDQVDRGLFMELNLYRARHPFSYHTRGVLHTEFTTPAFFARIPVILKSLDAEWAENGPLSHCIQYNIADK